MNSVEQACGSLDLSIEAALRLSLALKRKLVADRKLEVECYDKIA